MPVTYKDCLDAAAHEKRRSLGDDLKRPLTAYEQQIVYGLYSFASFIDLGKSIMDKRNRHIKRAAMRMGLLKSTCRSLFGDYMAQLDERGRETFRRRASNMQLSVITRRVQEKTGDGWMLVREEDLSNIAQAAWKSSCVFCGLKGQEAKQCPLRKTLDGLQCIEPSDNPDCWYRGD